MEMFVFLALVIELLLLFLNFIYFMSNTNVGKQLRYLCHYSYHIINAILEEGYDGVPTFSNLLFLKQTLNNSREVLNQHSVFSLDFY